MYQNPAVMANPTGVAPGYNYGAAALTMAVPSQMGAAPLVQQVIAQQPSGPGQQQAPGDTKLFVGNLSPETTSAGLGAYFAQFGPVLEARIVMDRATGRSKGYAFITFADAEGAARAAAPGNHQIDGRSCNVNLTSQKDQIAGKRSHDGTGDHGGEKRPRFDHGAYAPQAAAYNPYPGQWGVQTPYAPVPGFMGGAAAIPGRPGDPKIFIAGLAPETSDARLKDVLTIFGDVADAKVVMDKEKNESKGYAFVTFADPAAAMRAAQCSYLFIDNRRCPTNLASAKPKK